MDWLKTIHLTTVTLSLSGFAVRGLAVVLGRPWAQRYWQRGYPHYIDTILLVSATALALRSGQYPFVDSWLTAKVVALLAYITLGFITLRVATNRWQRLLAYLLALGCGAYIVWVARMRYPAPWELGHPFF